jgi:acyl-CoA synthetase (NDP forming)
VAASVQAQPPWQDRLRTGAALTEHEAKRFLADHGIRTTREALARDAHEAVRVAREIGFPVVAKIQSPDIPHKTEAGGVALSLASAEDVESAFHRILDQVRRHAPGARLEGVVIQEMVRGGVEMIVGSTQHPPFGRGIVVGSGGVLVELVQDSALALAPVDRAGAQALVGRTRAAALLAGFRGAPPADREALEEMVARLSALAEAYADCIAAIDLNPVAVLPRGQGACVLDALIVPSPKAS